MSVTVAADPITSPGNLLGTLHDMSPEQLEGQNVDARSDLAPLKITEELSWPALSPR